MYRDKHNNIPIKINENSSDSYSFSCDESSDVESQNSNENTVHLKDKKMNKKKSLFRRQNTQIKISKQLFIDAIFHAENTSSKKRRPSRRMKLTGNLTNNLSRNGNGYVIFV